MNARGMCKCIRAHHRLVGLHSKTSNLRYQLRGRHDLRSVDTHIQLEVISAGLHRHDDLFQRGIARTFTQAIDGALDLTRATNHHRG